ncbi:uncharacterized protein LOC129233516 [Uloborus diversus]|uniref:uncharacterized protein LOC129233516 n=1 Tax=Uloborus diversus TaxID=327109 RepID=UPI002409F2B7|nr:uncharacterized protein LOC129233516 [Uloborus diversus]
MAWLLEQGNVPEVIPNGSMVMSIKLPSLKIRVIDSLNFFPMALSKLPGCFGLKELKKGYFPHYFNTQSNQDYEGTLPELKYYGPDSMSPSARSDFIKWYEEHKNDSFIFQEEMLAYCRSDVDILRQCCIEFRSQFMAISKVDPFMYVTIASACMAVFRSLHIRPDTLAMVPVSGYVNNTKYSADSIRWLDFVASTEGVTIEHALSGTGEKKIAGLSVDGFCQETNTVYQFQGCFYHGCPTCFDGDSVHPLKGVTMSTLREESDKKTNRLRMKGFRVVEIWEHDFRKQKKEDPRLQDFLKTHTAQDRLHPRDAFFGGRTNALNLFYEGTAKYIDFTSLYPWVNKYCPYPVGHPTIITEGFDDIDQYFGIVKCRVVPPRGLYLTVLPCRIQDKLMFPLCRTCAENTQQDPCAHCDDDRALTGTWMYEVYHFPISSNVLFRDYIDLFLKIKQESSGWPRECSTEDEKREYIVRYEAKEGILLDSNAISKNPGRRQVAKLALNSFWGRFGMNTNKNSLVFVNSIPTFNKYMADSTKVVSFYPKEIEKL